MTDHLITFGALTFGIVLASWISFRSLPRIRSNIGGENVNPSVSYLISRSLVVFLAILGAFFILETSVGLSEHSRLTPFHAAYGAALILFLRGMVVRQSNKAQQRTEDR